MLVHTSSLERTGLAFWTFKQVSNCTPFKSASTTPGLETHSLKVFINLLIIITKKIVKTQYLRLDCFRNIFIHWVQSNLHSFHRQAIFCWLGDGQEGYQKNFVTVSRWAGDFMDIFLAFKDLHPYAKSKMRHPRLQWFTVDTQHSWACSSACPHTFCEWCKPGKRNQLK